MNNMQRVWVCGSLGRVGKELVKILKESAEVLITDEGEVDVKNPKEVQEFADINRPHFIINCTGYTDVLGCEQNVERAFQVNALGARNLALAARKSGAHMIQLSTDDVFDGSQKTPYTEFDKPNPQTVYGKSKLAGEEFVKEFAARHLIIRSSWIFGAGDNYVKAILEEAEKGENIMAAHDQIAVPTSAKELAKKVVYLMENEPDGLYHVTSQGSCSRYDYAREILRIAEEKGKIKPVNVTAVTAQDDPLTSMRPSYSVLDNLMLRMEGVEQLPDWKISLAEYIDEYYLGKEGK